MINEVYRCAIEALGPSGQQLVNVLHFRQISVGGSDEGSELAAAYIAVAMPLYQAIMSSAVAIINIKTRNVDRPTFGTDTAVTPPGAGALSSNASSPTAPQIMTQRTGLIGRSYRGRSFLFPTDESQIGGGQLGGTYAADVQTYGASLLGLTDPVSGFVYSLTVYSPTLSVDTLVTSFTPQEFQGRMGSRRAGVGS
jgi:hypothetical protein